MRILLFGGDGLLGREFQRNLVSLEEVYAPSKQEVDFSNFQKLASIITHLKPHIIINTAAYTDVDQAEREPALAMKVNGIALGVISEAANKAHSSLIHFSSDYVFDGAKISPYTETDLPNPINLYGESKLAGERFVQEIGGSYIIIRTSWLYSMLGNNFLTWLLTQSRQKRILKVVTDQVGSPTWARCLAEITSKLLNIVKSDPYEIFKLAHGIYHLANKGGVSRYEWARYILTLDPHRDKHIYASLQPALTYEFKNPAPRPPYSALDCSLFEDKFGLTIPNWKRSQKKCLDTIR